MDWVRLYHDMPTDPKWRVIARKSGQRVGDVIAVAMFLLTNGSANANERGRTQANAANFHDDIAAAIDLDAEHVSAIVAAMRDRFIDKSGKIIAWEKRNPIKDDGASERGKRWRERKRTQTNGANALESESESESEKKEEPSSAPADLSKPLDRKKSDKTYPEQFETFWRDYPTDPIMSKKKAHEYWAKLSAADKDAAQAAIPGLREHCRKNPTYRCIHAERFLSQRRFDGLNDAVKPLARREPHPSWNGKQSALASKIGDAQFDAYFAAARFDPGPPTVIEVGTASIKTLIERKFGTPLRAMFGEFEIAVVRDVSA